MHGKSAAAAEAICTAGTYLCGTFHRITVPTTVAAALPPVTTSVRPPPTHTSPPLMPRTPAAPLPRHCFDLEPEVSPLPEACEVEYPELFKRWGELGPKVREVAAAVVEACPAAAVAKPLWVVKQQGKG